MSYGVVNETYNGPRGCSGVAPNTYTVILRAVKW